MKYSLRILKNKNLFKRHKHPSPNALNIKYFWTFSYKHWGFLIITKLSNPLQENGMPNVWMRHCWPHWKQTQYFTVLRNVYRFLLFSWVININLFHMSPSLIIPTMTIYQLLNKIKNFQPVFYIFPGSPTV